MSMQWEYSVFTRQYFDNAGHLENVLNQMGRADWELVSAMQNETGLDKGMMFLKRRKAHQTASDSLRNQLAT